MTKETSERPNLRPGAVFRRNSLVVIALAGLFFGATLCAPAQPGASVEATMPSGPILAGDHPDPSIIRVGHTYWAASTSGDWSPQFPLLKSKDLQHWEPAGAVFSQTPAWATGDFWAPELVSDSGRTLVYYAARKRDGPLCVAVATADKPKGPYTDHGPIVCQPDGSIDPSFVRDENGQPFLVWKEDGNSEGKPTPIWAQALSGDLLNVVGSPMQLLVNEAGSWEGGVVEAPYILRHAGRFYLFYAGNACCGNECIYAEGVARADRMAGPWEKDPANPIIAANGRWKCPGHGTVVETPKGRDYLLYHAYPATEMERLGREPLLDEVSWTADGWPTVNGGNGPVGVGGDQTSAAHLDAFRHRALDSQWQWPAGRPVEFRSGGGKLVLKSSLDGRPVFLSRPLLAASFVAEVGVEAGGGAEGGLGANGPEHSFTVLARDGDDLRIYKVEDGIRTALWQDHIARVKVVWLRVTGGVDAGPVFEYSVDHTVWNAAGSAGSRANTSHTALRLALSADGAAGTEARFLGFSLSGGSAIAAH